MVLFTGDLEIELILFVSLDDPELFSSQPVCLQIVGRPFQDEEVVAVTDVVDRVINPREGKCSFSEGNLHEY